MRRRFRWMAVMVLLSSTLSGCIIDPWYADRGYDGGGGHHHRHHDNYRYGPRW